MAGEYPRYPTGAIPMQMYPDHVSGAMALNVIQAPPPPPDDLGMFARWWKMAALIAGSCATIGAVVWWVGTKLFVERMSYEHDRKTRDELSIATKNTLESFKTTLDMQTSEFKKFQETLQKVNTDLTVLQAVQDAERRGRRAR